MTVRRVALINGITFTIVRFNKEGNERIKESDGRFHTVIPIARKEMKV